MSEAAGETVVNLPTLHPDQVKALLLNGPDGKPPRFKAVRCGRRWGKTDLAKTVVGSDVSRFARSVGWFAPDYKIESEAFNEIVDMLDPIKKSSSKVEGVIRTVNGGRIDFWTLENERAGRSRKYHRVVIDEGAFTKPNMMDIWELAIAPTLLDYEGKALVLSNTNGIDSENFFWRICNQPEHGFVEYHAPSFNNPHIPARKPGDTDEQHQAKRAQAFADLKAKYPPLVYQQEYLAEFVDWSGVAFFERDRLLVLQGTELRPYQPRKVDSVFAVVDSAVKTGSENDGTAVVYYSYSRNDPFPLVMLDWDVVQIEGALLEHWIPNVYRRLEQLSGEVQAKLGSLGVWIEDKSSGSILLQQLLRRQFLARAIDSKLTSVGKDERAISISGYVYQGKVKFAPLAYEKTTLYKTSTRNHLLTQITGFRVGDKDAAKRADDLLDCFCYGVAIALGNAAGF